jgi:chorismate-pyruvate lyase
MKEKVTMPESMGRKEADKHELPAEQDRDTLQRSEEVLAGIHDERLRTGLTADKVTEHLENAFGVRIVPCVLYQGPPQMYPAEVSAYFASKKIVQRDIRIDVPCEETGTPKTVLFARSWISMDALDEKFREFLYGGKMTIGQIIRDMQFPVQYRNLGYKKVRSVELAGVFGTRETVRLIQRSRMIHRDNIPLMVIHEFVPE